MAGTVLLTLVWLDRECKVEHISWIWKVGLHRLWQFEFRQVCAVPDRSKEVRVRVSILSLILFVYRP